MKLFPSPQRGAGVRFSAILLIGALLTVFPSVNAFSMGTKGTPSRKESRSEPPSSARNAPAIRDILQRAVAPGDRVITITGVFRGWSGSCTGSPPLTRSDWMLEDGTGCIYVTGAAPAGLNAAAPRGETVRIEADVQIGAGGVPYLSARSVAVLSISPTK